jgi:hypothetical protein
VILARDESQPSLVVGDRVFSSRYGRQGSGLPSPPTTERATEKLANQDLFAEFKRGVGNQISDEDADSHLNLAMAYLEMSLYGDAVRELSVVIEGTRDSNIVNSALGLLLAPPLLKTNGLSALRAQLSSH